MSSPLTTTLRRLFLVTAFAAIPLFLNGCTKTSETQSPSFHSSETNKAKDVWRNGDAEPQPFPPITYAKPFDSGKVYVQATDLAQKTALIVGLPGASTEAGVTEACAVNERSGESICFPVRDTVGGLSFRAVISNSLPGDIIHIWPNGPGFLPGGVGLNDIPEKVLYWRTRFPERVTSMVSMGSEGTLVGSEEGLWHLKVWELSYSSPESVDSSNPHRFDILHGLSGNHVQAIAAGLAGEFYVATEEGGVDRVVLDSLSGKIAAKNVLKPTDLANAQVQAMAVDSKGRIWAGTNQGIVVPSVSILNRSSGLLSDDVNVLVKDDNRIWIGTSAGLALATVDSGGAISIRSYGSTAGLPGTKVKGLSLNGPNSLWIGYENSVVYSQFAANGNILTKKVIAAANIAGQMYTVESVAATQGGRVFIGTQNNGVCILGTRQDGAPIFYPLEDHGTAFSSGSTPGKIVMLLPDGEGVLAGSNERGVAAVTVEELGSDYLTTPGGAEIGLADPDFTIIVNQTSYLAKFRHLVTKESLRSNDVTHLSKTPWGDLVIGGRNRGAQLFSAADGGTYTDFVTQQLGVDPNDGHVHAALPISSQSILFGMSYGYGVALDPKLNTAYYRVERVPFQALAMDSDGKTIWIGTNSGLWTTQMISSYPANEKKEVFEEPLNSANVAALLKTAAGDLWVATTDQGLFRIFVENGVRQVEQYTETSGLSHRTVRQLALGSDGAIWAATAKGLTRILKTDQGYQLRKFGLAAGLQSEDVLAVGGDATGGVWAGTALGLAHVSPVPLTNNFTVRFYSKLDGLPNHRVQAVSVNSDDSVYLGLANGFALFVE